MGLNTVLDTMFTKAEQDSWYIKKVRYYDIRFTRNGEWFAKSIQEQTDKYPRGITRQQAKATAGKTGHVYLCELTRERIQ